MKIFLFNVTLFEGEHEYSDYALIKAKDQETAWKIGEKEMHDFGDEENGYWNYGDDTIRTKPEGIQEISREDAEVLTRLGVVFYLN